MPHKHQRNSFFPFIKGGWWLVIREGFNQSEGQGAPVTRSEIELQFGLADLQLVELGLADLLLVELDELGELGLADLQLVELGDLEVNFEELLTTSPSEATSPLLLGT